MPMKPAVGRSFAPFTLPVKREVVNAAPAVFRKLRRLGFCSFMFILSCITLVSKTSKGKSAGYPCQTGPARRRDIFGRQREVRAYGVTSSSYSFRIVAELS